MNGKTKTLSMIGLVLLVAASILYIAPAFARMNGDTDQTQDRLRQQDGDCICDCPCDCDCGCQCERVQLRTRACPNT